MFIVLLLFKKMVNLASIFFLCQQLIAEAWDAGGLYQVGTFPHGGVWSEWNGQVSVLSPMDLLGLKI